MLSSFPVEGAETLLDGIMPGCRRMNDGAMLTYRWLLSIYDVPVIRDIFGRAQIEAVSIT